MPRFNLEENQSFRFNSSVHTVFFGAKLGSKESETLIGPVKILFAKVVLYLLKSSKIS